MGVHFCKIRQERRMASRKTDISANPRENVDNSSSLFYDKKREGPWAAALPAPVGAKVPALISFSH